MNEQLALEEARREFPQVPDWQIACPVLPTDTSLIESASWLVMSSSGKYFALVDGHPTAILMRTV